MEFQHKSVLLEECIEGLNIRPEGIYLDGTLGGAGHSSQIARRLTTGRLIGVDRDQVALAAAGKRLEPWKDRVTLVHSNFKEIDSILDGLGIQGVDGMLFDLGVSSPQLDDGERGFSYMHDAPLDMSFSGLKTAMLNLIHNAQQKGEDLPVADLAASFSAAVSGELVPRTMAASAQCGYGKVAVVGGVAANSRIRRDLEAACAAAGDRLYLPPLRLCGDNGAMIGSPGYYEYLAGTRAGADLNAYANRDISLGYR